jgi:hypothetical protein
LAGPAAGGRLPGGEILLTPPPGSVEVVFLCGRCHRDPPVCGSNDVVPTGSKSGSVRRLGGFFAVTRAFWKQEENWLPERTDRPVSSVVTWLGGPGRDRVMG